MYRQTIVVKDSTVSLSPDSAHMPFYVATEIHGDPGVYSCPAWGPRLATAEQLRAWAHRAAVELVFVREPSIEIMAAAIPSVGGDA